MSGKLRHEPITIKAAQAFVDEHHRHCKAPRGARFAIAAWCGDLLVGVVIVGRPVARMLSSTTTAEIVRCCVLDDAPRNTNSYLYGAARRVWQAWGGKRVITYTLDSESGDSLRGAGFVPVAKTHAAPKGWGRKSRQRAVLATDGKRKIRWQAEASR
jgi:hypothetical protein